MDVNNIHNELVEKKSLQYAINKYKRAVAGRDDWKYDHQDTLPGSALHLLLDLLEEKVQEDRENVLLHVYKMGYKVETLERGKKYEISCWLESCYYDFIFIQSPLQYEDDVLLEWILNQQ